MRTEDHAIAVLIHELVTRLECQKLTGNTENPEVFMVLAKAALTLIDKRN